MIKKSNQTMAPEELDDYAHQLAAILIAGLISTETLQYVAHMFTQAQHDKVFEALAARLVYHLEEALTPNAGGLSKIHKMAAYLGTLAITLENQMSEVLTHEVGDKETVKELDALETTHQIFKGAADNLHGALRKVTQEIIGSWQAKQERKCVATEIQREFTERMKQQSAEEDNKDKETLH